LQIDPQNFFQQSPEKSYFNLVKIVESTLSGIFILLIILGIFLFAYVQYGNKLSRNMRLDDSNPTPANTLTDKIDYVPARAPVLLGHHFASIAGAGPIVGPIIAAAYGWLPVALWIAFGAVLIGGVHDFGAIVASIRHRGKSIGELILKNIGRRGELFFLLFSYATLILVIAVFINIVADTFVKTPSAGTSSIWFMILAIVFGLTNYRLKLPLTITSIAGVTLLFVGIVFGNHYPLVLDANTWRWLLLAYVFTASVTPVWILLQPRDYLNSFLLYALIAGGAIGMFFYRPHLNLPVFTSFTVDNSGPLFPIIFVTVACGAISGFHALVASGTTSKQLNKESDARLIGYGGMLIEGILAVIALVAVASLEQKEFESFYQRKLFVPAFAEGVGRFMHAIPILKIEVATARTFTALAVSAFALTSLDTATRIGRYTFQEFFQKTTSPEKNFAQNRFFATFCTVLAGALLTFSGKSDAIWPIFGSANQMLAALTLMTVTVWLAKTYKTYLFTLIPAVFMLLVTVTSLSILCLYNFSHLHNNLLGSLALILLILALMLTVDAIATFRIERPRSSIN